MNEPFDPWSGEVRADPHPMYHAMREQAPVYRATGPVTHRTFYFLTPYDTVLNALRDPRLGREWQKLPEGVRDQHHFPEMDAFEMVNRHVLNMDPPDHTRLRRLVSSAFTPKRIRDLEPRIAEIASRCLDAAEGQSEFDLLEQLAMPLPVTVIAELLGVPIEDQEHFRDLVDRILRPADDAAGMVAGMEMIQYVNGAIEYRKANPGGDLLSALIHLEEEGDRLDHSELLSMVQLLLIAGHETTVNLIGNGMLELMSHPEQFALLLDDPSLIDSAIEEMLRFNGPVETTFPRFAYEDVELDGVSVACGDQVIPVLLAANRDPERFEDPDRFDITRQPNKHIGFGFGIHYCLGAPLARLEAKVAIRELLERHPRIRLAVARDSLEWTPDPFLRGVRELPVSV
ncbi:MAG: cytochrome P450 [Acidimicrobiia bacterium]|nr:cytochrome P450 [Acidimicrobiia bacterium]